MPVQIATAIYQIIVYSIYAVSSIKTASWLAISIFLAGSTFQQAYLAKCSPAVFSHDLTDWLLLDLIHLSYMLWNSFLVSGQYPWSWPTLGWHLQGLYLLVSCMIWHSVTCFQYYNCILTIYQHYEYTIIPDHYNSVW